MKKILAFFSHYREAWLWPLVGLLFFLGSIKLVTHLTNYKPVEQPGALIDLCMAGIGLLVISTWVGALQGHIIPDWDKDDSWQKLLICSLCSVILLCFFGWLVLHK